MKQFVAQLTDNRYINVQADRMELRDNTILAYDGDVLVAVATTDVVISAHISEKATDAPTTPTIPTEEQETPQPPTPQTPPEQSLEPTGTAYKGFLYIKCEACGNTKGFCAKTPIKRAVCKCGHATELRNMKPLFVNCECGETFKYRTNLTERMTSINCIKCGSPVDLEYHDKKGVYATIK